jgi:hypothetical protein
MSTYCPRDELARRNRVQDLVDVTNYSDDLFDDLRDRLGKRTRDRESSVRVQAVIALARFQSSEDEAGIRVTKALIELLQHDPSAYNLQPKDLIIVRFVEQFYSTWNKLVPRSCSSLNELEMSMQSTDAASILEA